VADTTCDGNSTGVQDCNMDSCTIVGFLDILIGSQSASTFVEDSLAGEAMKLTIANLVNDNNIKPDNVSVIMTAILGNSLLQQKQAERVIDDKSQANVHIVYIINVDDPTAAAQNLSKVTPSHVESSMMSAFDVWYGSADNVSNCPYSIEEVTAVASTVADARASQNPSAIIYGNADYAVGDLSVANHNPGGYVPPDGYHNGAVDKSTQDTAKTDTATGSSATATATAKTRSAAIHSEAMPAVCTLLLMAIFNVRL